MAQALVSPGDRVRRLWARLSPWPGGRWLYSRLLGVMAPYSGSIRARIVALEPGFAAVRLRERRAVRNHLASVHAIALANLAELATGLAMSTALPPTARGILVAFRIRYVKKARGTLTAECRCDLPDVTVDGEHEFPTTVRDAGGDAVAEAVAIWKLGPIPPGGGS